MSVRKHLLVCQILFLEMQNVKDRKLVLYVELLTDSLLSYLECKERAGTQC